jgi:membrane-associated phospholipid phosphatase
MEAVRSGVVAARGRRHEFCLVRGRRGEAPGEESMGPAPEDEQARVARVLEEELARVDSPATAEAVVERVERLAAGQTEAERAAAAEEVPAPAAAVERAAQAPAPPTATAAALTTAASQAVADRPEAPAVVAAAQEAVGVAGAPAPPAARRGGHYLREAVLRRMGPLQALDARLFLAVNELPHPRWADGFLYGLSLVTTGGWIWALGVLVARRRQVRGSRGALRLVLPTVIGATWLVEHPIKEAIRRRRPFIDVVRALVVGKKPGSWSFPSGHTASAFAGAWVLSRRWPRGASLFYAVAATVGFGRVYLGAHYPGDVTSGAVLGTALAEAIRRLIDDSPRGG